MGYVRRGTVYHLVFADPEFDGLEVRAAAVPTGQLMEMARRTEKLGDLGQGQASSPGDVDEAERLLRTFSTALVSWNVELPVGDSDDAVPVPATLDGLRSLDFPFVYTVIVAWIDAGTTLPQRNNSEAEESLPMQALAG